MKLLHIHIGCGLICALFLLPFLFRDEVDFVGIRYENLTLGNQEDTVLNVKVGLWRMMLGMKWRGVSCHRVFDIQCKWYGFPCWNFWALRSCVIAAIMFITAAVIVGSRSGLSEYVQRYGLFAILFAFMIVVFTVVLTWAIFNKVDDTNGFIEFLCETIGQGKRDCSNTLIDNCLSYQSGYSVGEGRPRGLNISINKDISYVFMSQILFLFLSMLGIMIWCCFMIFLKSVTSKEDGRLSSSIKCKHQLMIGPRKEDYGSSRREGTIQSKAVTPGSAKSLTKVVTRSKRFLPESNPNVKLLS